MKQTDEEREELRQSIQGRGRDFKSFDALALVMIALCAGTAIRGFCIHAGPISTLFFRLSTSLVAGGAYFLFRYHLRSNLGDAGENLIPDATLEDVNELLTLTRNLNGEARLQARNKLLELLPRITEENAPLLTLQGQKDLSSLLASRDWELILLSLGAIENGGTGLHVHAVRALAQGKHLASSDPEIREVATLCLTRIEERLAKSEYSTVLLRPSIVPSEPETLLRPIATSLPEEPELLLRSGEKPE